MNVTIRPAWIIAGVAVGGALLWAASRGARETGQAIGGAAVDLANGVLRGTVEGIGQTVGIPPTNLSECERAKREGRTWDASFACPAADFIRYLWN